MEAYYYIRVIGLAFRSRLTGAGCKPLPAERNTLTPLARSVPCFKRTAPFIYNSSFKYQS